MRTLQHILVALTITLAMGWPHGAQAQSNWVLDGAYIKEHIQTQRVVPYPYIRQADVMWERRVWREIDLREKMNLPLYYPIDSIGDRKSLFDVIRDGILNDGSITAYSPGPLGINDEFSEPMTPDQVAELLTKVDTSVQENIFDPGTWDTTIVVQSVGSAEIVRYQLKEDWIFDRQRSVMDIRIIGICPLKENYGDDGEFRGYSKLFWLYFPELRYVLVNWDAFNRENDAERRSFDHVFWTRQFSSVITKVSNVYDRNIAEYKQGMDALLLSEEIKADLFNFEHDLWNY